MLEKFNRGKIFFCFMWSMWVKEVGLYLYLIFGDKNNIE